MTHLEEFVRSIASLPAELKENYSKMQKLDQQFQESQKQMEELCEQELEDAKNILDSDALTYGGYTLKFSNKVEAISATCEDLASQKITIASQVYDMVDGHIRRLDKYLKKFDEELKRGAATIMEQRHDVMKAADVKANRKKAQVVEQPVSMDLDLPVDPNEPTYCHCNRVSFGEMVACDNPDCKIEWFHFECVGIKERPKGKWYCSDCAPFMKRHRTR